MTIRPIAFDETNKVYTMIHDEGDHTFAVLLTDLQYGSVLDRTDHRGISINCTVCGASTFHPVSGGADPLNVQRLFVNKTVQDGCACGNVGAGNENIADAHAHLNCARMEGPDRWQL